MATRTLRKSAHAERSGAGQEMFAERRRRFLDFLGNAAAILPAAPEAVRNADTRYPYRQDSDFYYLTGFAEPGAVAVLLPEGNGERYVLFVRPRDPEREVWDGRRAGVDGALRDFGADAAYPIEEFEARVGRLLEGVNVLYFGLGRDDARNRQVLETIQRLKLGRQRRGTGPVEIRDPGPFLSDLRLRKSEGEIARLRRAAEITCEAHLLAMRTTRPGMNEYEVEALLGYVYRARGGSGPGYNHIVAGGDNATILHYNENDQVLRDGELLLIDSAAEYQTYTADVTRTFPVGSAFTPDQRRVYDIVLRAQLEAIEEVRPGRPFDAAHERAVRVITEGLIELGILEGHLEELLVQEAYKPYYMHRTGHWLGIDVHDVGLYVVDGQSRPLEPGMVLTVEPGLYFGEYAGEVDPRWRGIGVRIEDDILVTEQGNENLTAACPKDPVEIEKLRAEGGEHDVLSLVPRPTQKRGRRS